MLTLPDLPPRWQEPAICAISAAYEYGVPADALLSVAQAEGGHPGQWVKNTNGTYDIGTLQFNTAYLRSLSQYGITPAMAAQPGCYPFRLAAWRLHYELETDRGDFWTRIACYHSKTPYYNARYRAKLIRFDQFWRTWIERHFVSMRWKSKTTRQPTGAPVRLAVGTSQ